MEDFILDFDLKGRNYIVLVKPYEREGMTHYRAALNEDLVIDFSQQGNGELQPAPHTDADPVLVNAIANRILEHVHSERNNDNILPIP